MPSQLSRCRAEMKTAMETAGQQLCDRKVETIVMRCRREESTLYQVAKSMAKTVIERSDARHRVRKVSVRYIVKYL